MEDKNKTEQEEEILEYIFKDENGKVTVHEDTIDFFYSEDMQQYLKKFGVLDDLHVKGSL